MTTEDDTLTRLRADFTTEQLMDMEDRVRSATEHLKLAREILRALPGDAALEDLDDLIEEGGAAVEMLREARR